MKIKRLLSLAVAIFISVSVLSQVQKDCYFYSIGSDNHTEAKSPSPEYQSNTVDYIDSTEIADTIPAFYNSSVRTVAFPLERLSLSSPFGMRKDPLNKKSHRFHSGIDLKAKYERVFAMLPGTVVACGYSKTGGNFVSIDHGACICSYLHLSKILVGNGDHVSAGSVVAISGNSGSRTTGPHLHVSCRFSDGSANKGKYFNPIVLLGFVAERLAESGE